MDALWTATESTWGILYRPTLPIAIRVCSNNLRACTDWYVRQWDVCSHHERCRTNHSRVVHGMQTAHTIWSGNVTARDLGPASAAGRIEFGRWLSFFVSF